jgi:hypothetical protein
VRGSARWSRRAGRRKHSGEQRWEMCVGRADCSDWRRRWRRGQAGRCRRCARTGPEDWAGQKAGYRCFENAGVRPEALLASHRAATVERMASERVALAVQDTPTLDSSQHPATLGLGALKPAKQRGLVGHTTLAVTPERLPLGLLDRQVWTRTPATVGTRVTRRQRAITETERQQWLTSLQRAIQAQAACPRTRVVGVGEREADVYDLFLVERPAGLDLLIRAAWDQQVDGPQPHLWWATLGVGHPGCGPPWLKPPCSPRGRWPLHATPASWLAPPRSRSAPSRWPSAPQCIATTNTSPPCP